MEAGRDACSCLARYSKSECIYGTGRVWGGNEVCKTSLARVPGYQLDHKYSDHHRYPRAAAKNALSNIERREGTGRDLAVVAGSSFDRCQRVMCWTSILRFNDQNRPWEGMPGSVGAPRLYPVSSLLPTPDLGR